MKSGLYSTSDLHAGTDHAHTTASVEALSITDGVDDPTPGLVLVASRLTAPLPNVYPCADAECTFGRGSECAFVIPDAAASRVHARVSRRVDGVWLSDCGSTNGTLVHGVRLREPHRLREHDLVRIGDSVFRFVSKSIALWSAYSIRGDVISLVRPVRHGITAPFLVGGYQIDAINDLLDRVARTNLSVVIRGESGTGKELAARELHRQSGRKGPFQAINCASLPPALLESELFGYRRGAFTGANADKPGLVRAAHGGTLFLDEIGDMPIEAQAKLLRVLQEREIVPVGATTPERVDVRVACATHRDLDAAVDAARFRGDLLARLREVEVMLPPLRERREDLVPLVRHFLAKAGRSEVEPTFAFLLAVTHYGWPYNVRELESAIRLALALARGPRLDLAHLPEAIRQNVAAHGADAPRSDPRPPHDARTPAIESRAPRCPSEAELRSLLERHEGNIAAVGRSLGKERMQIHRWLRRYGIDIDEYRSS